MEVERGTVDLWVATVDARSADWLRPVLSDDERARADRFRAASDRDSFIVSRGILRNVLSRYAGVPPARIAFTYGEHGKPFVAGVRFNVSDSADLSVIAVSGAGEPGVDIERIRPKPNAARFAARFFSAPEAEAIGHADQDRESWFFACWTRKEAHVKALGGGLTIPLKSFTVECDPAQAHPSISAPGWRLTSFRPAPGFIGAICTEGAGLPRLEIRRME